MSNKGKSVNKNKLVCGIGLNDSKYPVLRREGDKKYTCPKYAIWTRMLARCYDPKTHGRQPSYIECSVCDEWLVFSNFCRWLDTQDWENRQLDKDLLQPFNKVYSPSLCCFLTHAVNTFLTDNKKSRGDQPLWVCYKQHKGLYEIRVQDPLNRYSRYVGSSRCPLDSHKKGQARKHEYACELSEFESDIKIKTALMTRFSSDKNWLNA